MKVGYFYYPSLKFITKLMLL